ncbi:MAG: DUF975 family protein [Velocimicrobium sp.]
MWKRSELKQNAKLVLKRTYWLSFAVSLVASILAGVSSSASTMNTMQIEFDIQFPTSVIVTVGLFSLLYGIFISSPLSVGLNNFFLTSRQYDVSLGRLFTTFSNGSFLNVVKVLFFRGLYIFFWSMLLIIPGIIKGYEYFFIPYILAENPELPQERVFEISKRMTQGEKFDIFILQLSFIGWELLGLAFCLVGINFVVPYINATFAELYSAKRAQALMNGIVTEQELCGFHGDDM